MEPSRYIRVENQPQLETSLYGAMSSTGRCSPDVTPFRILFIKPYNSISDKLTYGPPLGILTLISGLRRFFGDKIHVVFWDMKLYHDSADSFSEKLDLYFTDVVGVYSLIFEAQAIYEIETAVNA